MGDDFPWWGVGMVLHASGIYKLLYKVRSAVQCVPERIPCHGNDRDAVFRVSPEFYKLKTGVFRD